ncbi:LuxR family transcriptional regulator [Streptomyces murinus]|uniref:DNA-binding NarL/FixJ family response regulator n=2 Tax=Streptomyces murinus TaxID=33900 RepID=A0A7W3RNF2_STRMR|nr:DNA-binding NarL/FixJ family response regulator [Streptomyces murinus]
MGTTLPAAGTTSLALRTTPRATGTPYPATGTPHPTVGTTITPSLWKTGDPVPAPRAMLGQVETRSPSPVFVGRAEELTVLHDALTRAAAGQPQTLLLGGEAGVGKTRLVEEFTTAAADRDALVAVGGCVEIGAEGLPFAPFSAALRALRAARPEEFATATAGQEEELARLLPELGEHPAGGHDEHGMARLFELTARLLARLATGRTIALVLEDLHWADASTRHLLAYLLRTPRTGRLLVLATYRSDDIHRRHPLRPLLAELDRLRTVHRIDLPRLTREEAARLIAGILAREPDPAQVDAVFERSDGNAFFVEELAVAAREGRRTGLTDSLRDLLLVRVETLPEPAQRIARIIAEGGSTVEYRLLAAVAGLPEDDLIEALRAAVGANILTTDPDGTGYRFRHSLSREAVADDLLPGERSRLNRRYAEALDADPTLVPADTRLPRLAGYWYHAHEPAKALPAVLAASAAARRRHAYTEQLGLLERAMELWDSAPEAVRAALRPVDRTPCGGDPTTPLSYLDLLAEAVVAGRFGGERERALTITKRALRLLEDAPDPLRAAWFWLQRSRLVQAQAQGDGRRELATAEELVRGLPPSEVHAEVLTLAANWSMRHRPGPEAFAAAEQAVQYARMVGARDIELHARLTLGGLQVDAGAHEPGLAQMRQVLGTALAEGMHQVAGRAYVNLPTALTGLGRNREAVPLLHEGLAFAREHGLPDSEAWMWAGLAEARYALGQWPDAAQAADHATRIGHGTEPRAAGALKLAHLALAHGDLPEAARRLATARDHFGDHDPMPHQSLPPARVALGIAAGQGRLADARAELLRALDAGLPTGAHRHGWPLLRAAATAEADTRALPTARAGRAEILDRLTETARTLITGAPLWDAYDQWTRAELRRADGRDTVDTWTPVVTAFEHLDRPYDLARVRLRLAGALLRAGGTGDRDRALELLRLAAAVATHMDARPLMDAVTRSARRARLALTPGPGKSATAPADPAADLGLTAREQEVLRRLAAGRTNRQMAEELFISPKTVSVHVSNILAKLGVSSRGEAAALAHRLGLFPAQDRLAAG